MILPYYDFTLITHQQLDKQMQTGMVHAHYHIGKFILPSLLSPLPTTTIIKRYAREERHRFEPKSTVGAWFHTHSECDFNILDHFILSHWLMTLVYTAATTTTRKRFLCVLISISLSPICYHFCVCWLGNIIINNQITLTKLPRT
jgi:hypothetical protein